MTGRTSLLASCFAVALAALGCGGKSLSAGQSSGAGADDSSSPSQATTAAKRTTLYANDMLRDTYSFTREEYGHILQDGEVRNRSSHISYSDYVNGAFTVGIQGGEQGIIIDLGTDEEVAERLGVAKTVADRGGFAALTVREGESNDPQATRIYTDPIRSTAPARAIDGHVYILRIVDRYEPEMLIVVKLLVVSLAPGAEATFEWVRLQ